MDVNNFKLLEAEVIASRKHNKEEVKNKLHANIKLFDLIGDIAEVFVSRMPDAITQMIAKGNNSNKISQTKNTNQ
jgi:hypothetical protein